MNRPVRLPLGGAAVAAVFFVALTGMATTLPLWSSATEPSQDDVSNFVRGVVADDYTAGTPPPAEAATVALPILRRKEDRMAEDIAKERAVLLRRVAKSEKKAKRSKIALLTVSAVGGALLLAAVLHQARRAYLRRSMSWGQTDEE